MNPPGDLFKSYHSADLVRVMEFLSWVRQIDRNELEDAAKIAIDSGLDAGKIPNGAECSL